MKACLAILSAAAMLAVASSSFAGPAVGQARFGQRITQTVRHQPVEPYALTGTYRDARTERWEARLRGVGARKVWRTYYVRVKGEQ